MFTVVKNLTGFRPQKDDTGTLTTTPTSGTLRLSAKAASFLKVGDGDYVNVVEGQDAAGNTAYAIHKATDETGAKLASPNTSGSGNLNFSSSGVYVTLGGSSEGDRMKKVYQVAEEATIVADGEGNEVAYHMLSYLRDEEPVERKSKEEAEA